MASFNKNWPMLLDLDKDDCRKLLRRYELQAYASVITALRAQGDLNLERRKILRDLADLLSIPVERHKCEVRRVLNDEKLYTVAYNNSGPSVFQEWTIESKRMIPLLPRIEATNVFTSISNKYASEQSARNKTLPPPSMTRSMKTKVTNVITPKLETPHKRPRIEKTPRKSVDVKQENVVKNSPMPSLTLAKVVTDPKKVAKICSKVFTSNELNVKINNDAPLVQISPKRLITLSPSIPMTKSPKRIEIQDLSSNCSVATTASAAVEQMQPHQQPPLPPPPPQPQQQQHQQQQQPKQQQQQPHQQPPAAPPLQPTLPIAVSSQPIILQAPGGALTATTKMIVTNVHRVMESSGSQQMIVIPTNSGGPVEIKTIAKAFSSTPNIDAHRAMNDLAKVATFETLKPNYLTTKPKFTYGMKAIPITTSKAQGPSSGVSSDHTVSVVRIEHLPVHTSAEQFSNQNTATTTTKMRTTFGDTPQ